MTEQEIADAVGETVDRIDTLIAGLQIPISWEIRKQGMEPILQELRNNLRQAYVALSGDDPWAELDDLD